MGNSFSNMLWDIVGTYRKPEKRKHCEDEETLPIAPKKRKILSTTAYIYNTLFKKGQDSDITVVALGREWHLHRIYLRQSPYFESMFNGNWKDSNNKVVHIDISDTTVTVDALEVTLGSLYSDELYVSGDNVLGVLACAIFLQLDCVIKHCLAVLEDALTAETVVEYYDASIRYGMLSMEEKCVSWLAVNLSSQMVEQASYLRSISANLMKRVLSSNCLFVVQTEYSLYILLQTWLYVHLVPQYEGNQDSMYTDAHKYFRERKSPVAFLDTKEAEEYRDVFWQLRLEHIMSHFLDVEAMRDDNIIPVSWIQPAAMAHWYNMLKISQKKDMGPRDFPQQLFEKHCARYGRILPHRENVVWRWTGFNFDLDIVMMLRNDAIHIKRNAHAPNIYFGDRRDELRNFIVSISVASLNCQGSPKYFISSGQKNICLQPYDEEVVLKLENISSSVETLLISLKVLVYTPEEGSLPLVNRDQHRLTACAPPSSVDQDRGTTGQPTCDVQVQTGDLLDDVNNDETLNVENDSNCSGISSLAAPSYINPNDSSESQLSIESCESRYIKKFRNQIEENCVESDDSYDD